MFPVYDFLTPHTHWPLLLPSCVSNSACRIVKMVLESLSCFQASLHFFLLFTGCFRSSCPENQQVGYVV